MLLASTKEFQGACLDTGAQRTVIGKPQAEAYLASIGKDIGLDKAKDPRRFRLGGSDYDTIGAVSIRLPVANDYFLPLIVNVIVLNVPFLLGLDTLDLHRMYVNNVTNRLVCVDEGVAVPLVRKFGHIYLDWGAEILYTFPELQRIHKHFYHAKPERLYALMRRAKDQQATPETLRQLEDVTEACDVCQRLSKEPSRFRVAMPEEDIRFNRRVMADVMTLGKTSVLHVVDRDTLLSAAAFLRDTVSSKSVWEAFLRCWVTVYAGYPEQLHLDQGTNFQSHEWKQMMRDAGIAPLDSGVESHNSLGVGERYHAMLRHIFRLIRGAHPSISDELTLALAVWSMNQTAGPGGISPQALVLGINPRMPIKPVNLPGHQERCQAIVEARAEMLKLMAQARLSKAFRQRVPKAAGSEVQPGARVLVYREIPKAWEGPYVVECSDGKLLWLNIKDRLKLFSIDKVKVYKPPITPAAVAGDDTVANSPGATDAHGSPSTTAQPSDTAALDSMSADLPNDGTVADPAGAASTSARNASNGITAAEALVADIGRQVGGAARRGAGGSANEQEAASTTLITEVLEPGDPRALTPEMEAAKWAEADGLKRRRAWKKVHKRDVPAGANILGARFVNAIKQPNTPAEKAKSRFVAQGFGDKEKPFIVHNLSTLRQSSTKLIVSTSAVLGWRLFSHDVNQAYLQSKDAMTRDLYVRVRPKDAKYFKLQDGELLKLLKPLYGVADSGDYWDATFATHVKEDLGMSPMTGDPALFIKQDKDNIDGILGAYVDDTCMGGNETFQNLTLATLDKFESKPRVWDDFDFIGVSVRTLPGASRSFTLDQVAYIDALTRLPSSTCYEDFVRARAGFAWLAHGRPDLCCAINRAAQVTDVLFAERHLKEFNRAVKHAKATKDLCLRYTKLERESLHLRVYADASFASNDDLSSQLGYVVLLCDAEDRCHVLTYVSKKARRIVRSIMAGEVYAFADAFDAAYILKHDLERVYGQPLPLVMLTDSKQMFDVITRASHTTEKRLMIDVAAARDAYNKHEISNVGLVKSEDNIADGLTKPGLCMALDEVLRTGVDKNPVQQWIIRSSSTSASPADAMPGSTAAPTPSSTPSGQHGDARMMENRECE